MKELDGACVYVITSPMGMQKVGMSRIVRNRLRALRKEYGNDLAVHSTVPVLESLMRTVERRAHDILAENKLGGEWFSVTPDAALEAVKVATEELGAHRAEGLGEPPARFTMILQPALTHQVDMACEKAGGMSRLSWIRLAIVEKLARDAN
jgi:hypothetical protein